ncbi:Pentatricopeptide repeat [Dillenia turbinata]|uniref:Pentatricopeptide repeat n=1 Tax=Dillenia turbinata TaxID=194707 RepID=A0AAN8W036_9MAGN
MPEQALYVFEWKRVLVANLAAVLPNLRTYNVLIMISCRRKVLRMGSMTESGVHPDVVTYNAMLNGYCRFRRVDDSLELWELVKFSIAHVALQTHPSQSALKETNPPKSLQELQLFKSDEVIKALAIPRVSKLINARCLPPWILEEHPFILVLLKLLLVQEILLPLLNLLLVFSSDDSLNACIWLSLFSIIC